MCRTHVQILHAFTTLSPIGWSHRGPQKSHKTTYLPIDELHRRAGKNIYTPDGYSESVCPTLLISASILSLSLSAGPVAHNTSPNLSRHAWEVFRPHRPEEQRGRTGAEEQQGRVVGLELDLATVVSLATHWRGRYLCIWRDE
jgi:hypothetical protein